MDLLFFILICYGLTGILVYGKIFKKVRPKYHFFHCAQCVGFWVGVFVSIVSLETNVFSWELNWLDCLLLGFLSSGTSYVLNMIVNDSGIKFIN